MEQTINQVEKQTKTRINKRNMSKYQVVMHNDDKTPMDFVVLVLSTIFNKEVVDSVTIMMSIHESGRGIAGVYSKEIATTKMKETIRLATQHSYPLRLTIEEI